MAPIYKDKRTPCQYRLKTKWFLLETVFHMKPNCFLENLTSFFFPYTRGVMIFEHTSYRSYLKTTLVEKLKTNPQYSLRAFSKFLNISHGQLSMVLQGKKHISEDSALNIASRLHLDEKEADYFCHLVRLESAKTVQSKEFIQKRLETLHPKQTFHTLTLDAFKIVSDWHHYAILEMTELDTFKSDPAWIAKRLKISKAEVDLAIERLERLELIKNKKGTWVKTNEFFSVKSDLRNDALKKFHRQVLEKTLASLGTQDVQERKFGNITMSIDPSKLKEAEKRMEVFRLELAKFLSRGRKTQTYQLSTYLFKLTEGGK